MGGVRSTMAVTDASTGGSSGFGSGGVTHARTGSPPSGSPVTSRTTVVPKEASVVTTLASGGPARPTSSKSMREPTGAVPSTRRWSWSGEPLQ